MIKRNTSCSAGSLVLLLPLAACGGGGGGGIASAGSTTAPAAVNTSVVNPVASQSFVNDASTTTATIDTVAGVTNSASANRSTLTISYDAASRSYTVAEAGRSQTFDPSNTTANTITGEFTYKKTGAGMSDYLTLVTTPWGARPRTDMSPWASGSATS